MEAPFPGTSGRGPGARAASGRCRQLSKPTGSAELKSLSRHAANRGFQQAVCYCPLHAVAWWWATLPPPLLWVQQNHWLGCELRRTRHLLDVCNEYAAGRYSRRIEQLEHAVQVRPAPLPPPAPRRRAAPPVPCDAQHVPWSMIPTTAMHCMCAFWGGWVGGCMAGAWAGVRAAGPVGGAVGAGAASGIVGTESVSQPWASATT